MMNRLTLLLLPLLLFSLLPPASAGSSVYTFRATYRIVNTGSSEVEGWVEVFAFDNENFGWGFQRVLEENFSTLPQESRAEDNRILRFSLGKLSAGGSEEVSLTQILRVSGVRWENLEGEGGVPQELLRLTDPVPNLWENAPELREKAGELRGETPLTTARNLFEFVKDYLTYFSQAANQSALEVYRSRVGKCTEFTNLFIALARLSGLPAKFLAGYGYNPQFGDNAEGMGHAFVALYLPGVGWVPVDETWQGGQFGELSEDHLLLFSSDGSNLLRNGKVSIPGERWSGGTELQKSLLLYREAAVEVTVGRGSQENGKVGVVVNVRNRGRSTLEDLTVRLGVDETSFRPVSPRSVEELAPGRSADLIFYLEPLGGVENSPVEVEVEAMSPYGEVSSEGTLLLTVIVQPGQEPFLPFWFLLPVVGALVLILVLVKLRR
jgi:hypothetical protein